MLNPHGNTGPLHAPLERSVLICGKADDAICRYAGAGTTLPAAHTLGRR